MNNKGFSLMELIVTIGVLTVAMAIALPATSEWRQNIQYKEAAREVMSVLRKARSLAIQENQTQTVTVNLSTRVVSLAGAETELPQNVKIESKSSAGDSWQDSGTLSLSFRPQGSSNGTIFVRINEDDSLQVQVDSAATGLAHM